MSLVKMSFTRLDQKFESLSNTERLSLLLDAIRHPDTETAKDIIEKAETRGLTVDYQCTEDSCNLDSVLASIRNDPVFEEWGTTESIVKLVGSINKYPDHISPRFVDGIIVSTHGQPLIHLRNKTSLDIKKYSGISSHIDMSYLNTRLLHMPEKSWLPHLYYPIGVVAIILGGIAFSR